MRQSRNNFLLPPDAFFGFDKAQFGFQQFGFQQIKRDRIARQIENQFRTRIDRVIAEEECVYRRLLELCDLFHAIVSELKPHSRLGEYPESRWHLGFR